jgi:hypothetical protein
MISPLPPGIFASGGVFNHRGENMTAVDLLLVERAIRLIRGDKVILDEDLAVLYEIADSSG